MEACRLIPHLIPDRVRVLSARVLWKLLTPKDPLGSGEGSVWGPSPQSKLRLHQSRETAPISRAHSSACESGGDRCRGPPKTHPWPWKLTPQSPFGSLGARLRGCLRLGRVSTPLRLCPSVPASQQESAPIRSERVGKSTHPHPEKRLPASCPKSISVSTPATGGERFEPIIWIICSHWMANSIYF